MPNSIAVINLKRSPRRAFSLSAGVGGSGSVGDSEGDDSDAVTDVPTKKRHRNSEDWNMILSVILSGMESEPKRLSHPFLYYRNLKEGLSGLCFSIQVEMSLSTLVCLFVYP